ncbi:MAG: nickel pincer cofactor biosynthesis protein LarC [Actinomycetota bacterium]|nr:nickel pincer cofactor biosynthesis protein LarC [Actinomycetota bacterium]
MRICYFDCFSGAAGDMLLGALLDAGAGESEVMSAIGSLGIDASMTVGETSKRGFRAAQVTVGAPEQKVNRNLSDIEALLDEAALSARVRELSRLAFRTLGRAEAQVHGIDIGDVHFHEVGALDAIVDVVGTCAAFVDLGIERAVAGPLAIGSGMAQTDHGIIPVPAPAVTELLREAGAPVVAGEPGERLTPTGAALVVTLADEFGPIPPMRIEATGYGAGSRDTEIPNVVRVLVGESEKTAGTGSAILIQSNIDDMSPELIAHACERLLESGAADAWTSAIVMKKGRNAVTLSVLVSSEHQSRVLDVLFAETSALGVRMSAVTKEALERGFVTVEIDEQPVRVKMGMRGGNVVNLAPEYEDARAASEALGLPLKEVYARATELAAQSPHPTR